MIQPPHSLEGPLKQLFKEQVRYLAIFNHNFIWFILCRCHRTMYEIVMHVVIWCKSCNTCCKMYCFFPKRGGLFCAHKDLQNVFNIEMYSLVIPYLIVILIHGIFIISICFLTSSSLIYNTCWPIFHSKWNRVFPSLYYWFLSLKIFFKII